MIDEHDEPTFTATAPEYHQPTRESDPDLFAWLDWLHAQDGQMATDNPHALCFNCKGQARVMTACLYERATDHVCIWRKVK